MAQSWKLFSTAYRDLVATVADGSADDGGSVFDPRAYPDRPGPRSPLAGEQCPACEGTSAHDESGGRGRRDFLAIPAIPLAARRSPSESQAGKPERLSNASR